MESELDAAVAIRRMTLEGNNGANDPVEGFTPASSVSQKEKSAPVSQQTYSPNHNSNSMKTRTVDTYGQEQQRVSPVKAAVVEAPPRQQQEEHAGDALYEASAVTPTPEAWHAHSSSAGGAQDSVARAGDMDGSSSGGVRVQAPMQHQHQSEDVNDSWVLYYSEEGFPYYFNQITGESVWAETDQYASSSSASASMAAAAYPYEYKEEDVDPGKIGVRRGGVPAHAYAGNIEEDGAEV